MDRKFLRHHEADPYNHIELLMVKIDGSALTTSDESEAGVLMGAGAVFAKDDGANQVTITFKTELLHEPEVIGAFANTADIHINEVSKSVNTFVYKTVDADNTASAQADADVTLTFAILKTNRI